MTALRQQVARAQRQMWLNRWFAALGWSLVAGAGLFLLFVLVIRLFGLSWPVGTAALALAGCAVVASVIWLVVTREDAPTAAATLDRNAGLKERISSGLHVEAGTDPFERAVHQDAERTSAGLTVRRHVPLRWPDSCGYALAVSCLAGLVFWFLPTYDLLGRERERAEQEQLAERTERTRENVTRTIDRVKQLAQKNTALKEMVEGEDLDKLTATPASQPVDIQHNAIKKLGKLADTLREKREAGKFDAVTQMKNMLRQLRDPRLQQTPVGKLQKALAKGDFSKASDALKDLKDELKKAEQEGDSDQAKQLQKQLDALGDKLNKLARIEKLAKDLKQAGLNEEQVKRMLEQLAKMDIDQLRKQLEKQGLNKEMVEKLAKKMMQNQAACKACKQLGDAVKKMAQQGAGSGDAQQGGAAQGMAEAADQLSDLEMLEQQMGEMQEAMNEIQNAMNNLGGQGGPGGQQNKPGPGMGSAGQGQGGIAPEKETAFATKKRKEKVKTDRGQVIGKVYFDGAQIKGEAAAEYIEAVRAARDEETDALADDRIPRQLHGPVREYFKQVAEDLPKE